MSLSLPCHHAGPGEYMYIYWTKYFSAEHMHAIPLINGSLHSLEQLPIRANMIRIVLKKLAIASTL